MSYLTYLCCGLACTSLLFLKLMPDQKAHVAELAQRPPSLRAGQLMVLLLAVLVVAGTGLAVLPIFPETACLRIAGGAGCESGGGESGSGES